MSRAALTRAPFSFTSKRLAPKVTADRAARASDNRRLADDDAGSMIDEKAFADLGARMYIDAGLRMSDFGDDPRQHREAQP